MGPFIIPTDPPQWDGLYFWPPLGCRSMTMPSLTPGRPRSDTIVPNS